MMPTASSPDDPPRLLFAERGASWCWVLIGPATALMMLFIQHSTGYGFSPWIPLVFFIAISGMLALQVKAARIHTCVELTTDELRQGTETIRVDDIAAIYPPAPDRGRAASKWQQARTLGELSGVPRNRTGIGLRLADGRTARAWARNHRALRAVLTDLLGQRPGGFPDPGGLPGILEEDPTANAPPRYSR